MTKNSIASKKLFFFDLDGTLTKSKVPIDREMAQLLGHLLHVKRVAVISGARFKRLQIQLLKFLTFSKPQLERLFILPTSGTSLYRHNGKMWKKVYERKLSAKEKVEVFVGFHKVLHELSYKNKTKLYGKLIEDRGGQVTFSGAGQKAPLPIKREWNKRYDVRKKIVKRLQPLLPGFKVTIAGLTSIDVTKKGLDKTYGIQQIRKRYKVSLRDIVYVGDALYKDGNDSVVLSTGVTTYQVKNPTVTKKLIRNVLSHC